MAILLTTVSVSVILILCTVMFVFSADQGDTNHQAVLQQSLKYSFQKTSVEKLPQSAVPTDATILSSTSLPSNRDYLPEVGNGHIATVIQSDSIFMNGLYNGANYSSHRARIPSTAGYSISSTTPASLSRLYSLDVGRGVFIEEYGGNGVGIMLRTYAHRKYTRVLVTELLLSRDDVSKNVEVTVHLNSGLPSEDIDFSNMTSGILRGITRVAEYPELAPRTTFYFMSSKSLAGNYVMSPDTTAESYLGLTAIDVDENAVRSDFDDAFTAFENNHLLSDHVAEWSKVWNRASIDVTGDLHVSKINYASLYYILSSLPWGPNNKTWPFIGLSPGGLAHGSSGNDYNGHVFWDQDIWMFPSIALLHPGLGRTVVETRTKTLPAAKILAARTGFEGARFPWESAYTGLETCPASPYADYEIHINGDVSLMMRQYWQLTHDRDLMLNGSGAEIVWETAKFWSSRATYDSQNDTYRILNVMPPDEYHIRVNDSVYTNSIARINLNFANELKLAFGQKVNATWSTIANKLRYLYDKTLDYHPEYDGFNRDVDSTKQADVVLLSYPLMVDMNTSTRANDLRIYEKTTPIGPAPAMTWGMFLLGWLDLDNETKAEELFTRSILNVQQPFYVWSENSNGGGAVNFHTGMGGYLQSVLFGYGGIRLYDDFLSFNPKLINGTNKITFNGISYRDSILNLEYSSNELTLTLISVGSTSGLDVKFKDTNQWQKLVLNQTVTKNRQSFQVRISQ